MRVGSDRKRAESKRERGSGGRGSERKTDMTFDTVTVYLTAG